MREPGRAAGILQIANVVRGDRGQGAINHRFRCQDVPRERGAGSARFGIMRGGRAFAQLGDFGGVEEQHRVRAAQLDRQLVDIIVLAAKAGGQRQRHWPCAGIDRAAENRGKIGARFGDQRDAVALFDAARDQAAGHRQRVDAQFAERIGAGEGAARIVEIEAAGAPCRVIQRITKGGEIGQPARQGAAIGGRYKRGGAVGTGGHGAGGHVWYGSTLGAGAATCARIGGRRAGAKIPNPRMYGSRASPLWRECGTNKADG